MAPTYSYECQKCGEYEEVLPMADYQKKTKCPKCKRVGKKTIGLRQKEPTFTDKLYPYWDKSLNKVFHSPSERNTYLKANGLEQRETKGSMSAKQERMMYEMRLGNHDPRDRRYAN